MTARIGFLSTHPPTRSGLASFNAGGGSGGVVRLTTVGDDQRPGPDVVHAWQVLGWPAVAARHAALAARLVAARTGPTSVPTGGRGGRSR